MTSLKRNVLGWSGASSSTGRQSCDLAEILRTHSDLVLTSGDVTNVQLSGVSFDSRTVEKGDLYVGLPGQNAHGAAFATQAVARGAVAVLTDEAGCQTLGDQEVPVLKSSDLRRAMAKISAQIFGLPASTMLMFGITGTNGKTTTVFLLEGGLMSAGRHVGTIGTIGFRLDGQAIESARTTITTPESPDLQRLFATLHSGGADTIAMEVSSHALALDRVAATQFDVVGFTNLGRDHLDFHHTLEEYFQAKAKLFTSEYARRAVINIDGPAGLRMAEHARLNGVEVFTVGTTEQSDYQMLEWQPTPVGGAKLRVRMPNREASFAIDLPGEYNVSNATLALAMLDVARVNVDDAIPGLSSAQVPGRMQRVYLGDPEAPRVYVDFAHTPQAIASALSAISGRVIVVLGAGGDRDSTKRPAMGVAAAAGADVVIVTDDNPRSERPLTIRRAVLSAAKTLPSRATHIVDGGDRRSAIRLAMELATPLDAVAILGKGHETTQIIGERVIEFDDAQVAIEEWAAKNRWSEVDQWERE